MRIATIARLALVVLLPLGLATPSNAQVREIPTNTTPWVSLLNGLRVFNGDIYVKSSEPEKVWKYDGEEFEPLEAEGQAVTDWLLGVEIGDYLYFGGPEKIWRTDGNLTELFHEFPEGSTIPSLYPRDTHVIEKDNGVYFFVEEPSSQALYRLDEDGINRYETPESFRGDAPPSVAVEGGLVMSDGFTAWATIYIYRDETLAEAAFTDFGLPEDKPFYVLGSSSDYVYLWVEEQPDSPSLFRSNLETSEKLADLDPSWEAKTVAVGVGDAVYLVADGRALSWRSDRGLREEVDPQSGQAERWWIPWEPLTIHPVTGDTTYWLIRDLEDRKRRYVRMGVDGLEEHPDASALTETGLLATLVESDSGLCLVSRDMTKCSVDGVLTEASYGLRADLGWLNAVKYNDRIFWANSDGALVSVSEIGDPDLRMEASESGSDWTFLGSWGGNAQFSVSQGLEGGEVWETDGTSARRINPGVIGHQVFSNEEVVVFRTTDVRDADLWTWDGETVGSATDFFGHDFSDGSFFSPLELAGETVFSTGDQWWSKKPGAASVLLGENYRDLVGSDSLVYAIRWDTAPDEIDVYDGKSVQTIGILGLVASGFLPTATRLVGNRIISSVSVFAHRDDLTSTTVIWILEGRKATSWGVSEFKVEHSALHADGWLYAGKWDGSILRTDGETIEEFLPAGGEEKFMASADETLYYVMEEQLFRLVDGQSERLLGPAGEMSWLPESPEGGLFLQVDDHPYQVVPDGPVKLAEETFIWKGWHGQIMIGEKPDKLGVFALEVDPKTTSTEGKEHPVGLPISIQAYPSPTTGLAHVTLSTTGHEPVQVEIFDALGRRLEILHRGPLSQGKHEFQMNTSSWAAGVYLIRAVAPDQTVTASLVVSG